MITVSHRRPEENGIWYQEVAVSDEGPGIDPAQQQNLFNVYAQIPESGAGPARKGTGLGLAVSRLIVEMHNGVIGYRSRSPHGAVFFFRIPERDDDSL